MNYCLFTPIFIAIHTTLSMFISSWVVTDGANMANLGSLSCC